MSFVIYYERKYEYEPIEWTIGYCPDCEKHSPATKEKEYVVLRAYESKVSEDYKGDVFRCDLCSRLINPSIETTIKLNCWSPMMGVPELVNQLAVPYVEESFEINCSSRFHSILTAATNTYPLWHRKNLLAGIGLGFMGGFVSTGVLVLFLMVFKLLLNQFDELQGVGTIFMVGSAIGSIVGCAWYYRFHRNKSAFDIINRVYRQYAIDLDRLCEAAESHCPWIQGVAKEVRTKR